jgi:tripartite-type tricarboxylate transporter receptor subunit TctC
MLRKRLSSQLLITVVACAAVSFAAAQSYPVRPIRLVVAQSAGGNADFVARAYAQKLGERLSQQVVVDNRPGGAGIIGTETVARAVPDGYTLLIAPTGFSINPGLYAGKLPFDPLKDFAPITLVAYSPLMLVVNPKLPVNNVQELVAYLKAHGDKATYASAGVGTANQIAAEMLKRAANVPNVVHVPYKGSSPSAQAVLANEVTFSFLRMPPAVSNVASGTMRGLAVTSAKRVPAVPNIPTMIESGFPGFDLVVYSGILAPAGTPPAIIAKLQAEFTKAAQSQDVIAAFAKIGAEPITNTPQAFAALMASDIAKLAPVVRDSGATVE